MKTLFATLCLLSAVTAFSVEPLSSEEAAAKLAAKKAATSEPTLIAENDRLRREIAALKAENKKLLDEIQSGRDARVRATLEAAAAHATTRPKYERLEIDELMDRLPGMKFEELSARAGERLILLSGSETSKSYKAGFVVAQGGGQSGEVYFSVTVADGKVSHFSRE